jgi:predicted nucleotidyltransferase
MAVGLVAALDDVRFPTERQRDLTRLVLEQAAGDPDVRAAVLCCSLAAGYGDEDSDLDFAFIAESDRIEAVKGRFETLQEALNREHDMWCDIDVTDGEFKPGEMGWSDVDRFELEVGNIVVYSMPIFDRDGSLAEIRKRWLPYYSEDLAERRAKRFAKLTTNHVVQGLKSARRGHGFDSMDRLYTGIQTLIAGLYVHRRVYPVDYLKRLELHLERHLGMGELGRDLRFLFDVGELETKRLERSLHRLNDLALTLLPPGD